MYQHIKVPDGQKITVNAICPGYVWTPLVEAQIPDTMKARGLTKEQVINDVLDLSKIEAKQVKLDSSDFHLSAVFDQVVSVIGGAAHHKALYSEEQRAQVVELRGLGWMFKDIAQLLGMTSPVTAAKIWYAHERAERAEREVPSE